MVLKMEYLSHKLSGNPGLKEKIEKQYIPKIRTEKNKRPLTKKKISDTFKKLRDYSNFIPNNRISRSLSEKLSAIIAKITSLFKTNEK